MPNETLLRLEGIHKNFGPVQALGGVDLEVRQAEVHALIGENGAGKSTLMKVLSGAHRADQGKILFEDQPFTATDPASARRLGVGMIYQELNIAPHLSVEENITLGLDTSTFGFRNSKSQEVVECLKRLGHSDILPSTPAGQLSIGQQQIVEIARALFAKSRLIIMDEPTSSLSAEDSQALFKVIERLRDDGLSIIYISHFLEEVKAISDRYTVIRDGISVSTGIMSEASLDHIIEAMVGRSLEEMYPPKNHPVGGPVLKARELQGTELPQKADFELAKGEILGIAGLVGSGRSELIRCLFGLNHRVSGKVDVVGNPKSLTHRPQSSLKSGLNLLSENRKEEGLAVDLGLATNLTLSNLKPYRQGPFLNLKKERSSAQHWLKELRVKHHSPRQPASTLSGGNQQKVAIARLLHHDSRILLLDEPTRGIDVGSKAEIYRLIEELAGKGKSIVVVSSYLPELMGICDSLAVMHKGNLSPKKSITEWDENSVMRYATSGTLSS